MKEKIKLLVAIREHGFRQRDFAKVVGTQESIVSEVISGKRNIDSVKQKKWARALGKKPDELFKN